MNVRQVSRTTLSLLVLGGGLIYLLPVIRHAFLDGMFRTVGRRLYAYYYLGGDYLGGYYLFIVSAAIYLMIAVGMLDAILKNEVAFGVLFSLQPALMSLSLPMLVSAFVPGIDPIMFWGIMQLGVILGISRAFRIISHHNHPGGQKMILFIKKIKTAGSHLRGHVYDHYAIFGTSLLMVAVYAILVLSLLTYIVTHWQVLTGIASYQARVPVEPPEKPQLYLISSDAGGRTYRLTGAPLRITIAFIDRSWVRISQDGVTVVEQTFAHSQSIELYDAASTIIRLGYPRGAVVTVNGIALKNLETRGNPLNITVLRE